MPPSPKQKKTIIKYKYYLLEVSLQTHSSAKVCTFPKVHSPQILLAEFTISVVFVSINILTHICSQLKLRFV